MSNKNIIVLYENNGKDEVITSIFVDKNSVHLVYYDGITVTFSKEAYKAALGIMASILPMLEENKNVN